MLHRMLLVLGLFCTGCGPTQPESTPIEDCANGEDDDGDEQIDCLDDDCLGSCPEVCTDEQDNDGDGVTDCSDPDCDGQCAEVCDDGRDNDGDGALDCEDLDCLGECGEVCGDGRDNDGDGLTDCMDDDCASDACPELCSDERDNDGDGLIDCEDVDCSSMCPEQACDDGDDNDNDSQVDCEDSDCLAVCDADGDGYLDGNRGGDDCDDSEPNVHPFAAEACNSAADLDCDGLVAACEIDLPPFDRQYSHRERTRGFMFRAPADMTITELWVPDDVEGVVQNLQVVRFHSYPTEHPERTTDFESLFWQAGAPGGDVLSVSIDVAADDLIGVLGSRGTDLSTTSYGVGSPDWPVDLTGGFTTLIRLVNHGNLYVGPAWELSTDSLNEDIGRVSVWYH
jgi:hypothetical protein